MSNASDKQLKFIKRLQKRLGMDETVSPDITKDGAIILIDELLDLENGKKAEKAETAQKEPGKPLSADNRDMKIRFGLACKIALQHAITRPLLPTQKDFNATVKAFYDLMNGAEEEIFSSSSRSSEYNEAQAEFAMTSQAECSP